MGFGNSYCVAKAVKERLGDTAVTVDYNKYPAEVDALGKKYVESETQGVGNLTQAIKDYVKACPGKPIVRKNLQTIHTSLP